MIKTKTLISFLTSIIIVAGVLVGVHFLVYRVLPENYKVEGVIDMHTFLFLLTILLLHTILF